MPNIDNDLPQDFLDELKKNVCRRIKFNPAKGYYKRIIISSNR